MDATSTSAWETILNAGKRDDPNCDYQRVEEQKEEPKPTLEVEEDSMANAIQEVIADEFKQKMAYALAAIPGHIEEAVEHLFSALTFSRQMRIGTVVYNTVKHVILDRIRTAALEETINKHVDKYFEASKAVEDLGKRCSNLTTSST